MTHPNARDHPAVLVVEDDALLRIDIALAMTDAGFAVIEASDGEEALEVLERRASVSAIFTDIDMPGAIDGLELARIVRARWPEIAVLVTSGHLVANDDTPGRFFPKPYDVRDVISQVRDSAA